MSDYFLLYVHEVFSPFVKGKVVRENCQFRFGPTNLHTEKNNNKLVSNKNGTKDEMKAHRLIFEVLKFFGIFFFFLVL